jgi:hypothetical protein
MRWHYADYDPAARAELERRLTDTARRGDLVSYSHLVRGVLFSLPNVQSSPLELGVPEWTDLHRAILGDFLGKISCASYEQAGFLLSAVAVSGSSGEPSEGFRALAKELGLSSTQGATYLDFWTEQVRQAQDKYRI